MEHVQNDADKGKQRRKGFRLEELQNAFALNARGGEQPCRHRRAEVGTHDDAGCLMQGHQPRVDEADHHDRGCGGRLDDQRHAETEQKTFECARCELFKNAFQLVARTFFQCVAHDPHAEQEHGKSAEQGEEFYNRHSVSFILFKDTDLHRKLRETTIPRQNTS